MCGIKSQKEYGLPHATYIAMFYSIFCKNFNMGNPGVPFAHISMITWARDFKFAGAEVQRL